MFTGLLSAVGMMFIGAFGWIWHLGDRVTKLETRREDLNDLLEANFEAVNQRLDRIERAMNGALRSSN